MKNTANTLSQEEIYRQNLLYYYSQRDNAALMEYLESRDAEIKLIDVEPEIDPLDDVDPFEQEQHEQAMRDLQLEKDARWMNRVLRRILPK